MDKQPMYIQYHRHEEFDFRASSRKEAIERITKLINSMEHEHEVWLSGFIWCRSPKYAESAQPSSERYIRPLAGELNLPEVDDHKS
jgi:hypothetical protein